MPFADTGDARLFYTDEGDGEPVVLLHGWTCDSHDWSWQLDDFTARHRVIVPDLRGHGRSSNPGAGWGPPELATDVSRLLEQLGCGPAVIIGHSLGAVVASALAVQSPEQVRAVVAVDPGYGMDGPMADLIRQVCELLRGPSGADVAVAALGGVEGEEIAPALKTLHRRRILGTDPRVIKEMFSAMYEGDKQFGFRTESTQYLQGRTCPVLSFHVDAGRGAWEAAVSKHPYSEAVLWEGAGHWLHQSRPAQFNEVTLRWLAGLPAGDHPVQDTEKSTEKSTEKEYS